MNYEDTPTVAMLRLAFWLVIPMALFTGCSHKTTVNVATERLSPGWKVELLESSEPAEAVVMNHNPMQVSIPVPRPPSDANQKWIVVKMRVTSPPRPSDKTFWPPGVVGALGFSKITLLSAKGDSYGAEALATGSKWKDEKGNESPEFLQPGMSGVTIKDASGQRQFVVENGAVWFYDSEPKELLLLFAVPKRIDAVSLRL